MTRLERTEAAGTARWELLCIFLGAATVALVLLHQYLLLTHIPWEDEAETIVAARMMAAGARLYTEVFNQHGPLAMLPGYLLALGSAATTTWCRVLIAALQWGVIAAALRAFPHRLTPREQVLLLGGAGLWLTCILSPSFGSTYIYQALGGVAAAIGIALVVVPALLGGGRPGPRREFVGGFLLGCLPFLAISFGPAAVGLIACSVRRGSLRPMALGVVAAAALSIAFLVCVGSIPGYIAYHWYLNLFVLTKHSQDLPPNRGDLIRTALTIAALALICLQLWRRGGDRMRIALFAASILSFFLRGPQFHSLPANYALIPLFPFLIREIDRWRFPTSAGSRLTPYASAFIVVLLAIPWRQQFKDESLIPDRSTLSDLVKPNTDKDDRILVYSYINSEYLLADRLPASAHFFYLPSQAAYNEHPILGVHADPCRDIAATRPKFIKLDRKEIDNVYPWAGYQGCIEAVISTRYRPVDGSIYVRNDLPAAAAHATVAAAPPAQRPHEAVMSPGRSLP